MRWVLRTSYFSELSFISSCYRMPNATALGVDDDGTSYLPVCNLPPQLPHVDEMLSSVLFVCHRQDAVAPYNTCNTTGTTHADHLDGSILWYANMPMTCSHSRQNSSVSGHASHGRVSRVRTSPLETRSCNLSYTCHQILQAQASPSVVNPE